MSRITDESLRESLSDVLGESYSDVITYPEYATAFVGVTLDNRVIYDFFKMKLRYSSQKGVSLDEADSLVRKNIKQLELAVVNSGNKPPVISLGNPFTKE